MSFPSTRAALSPPLPGGPPSPEPRTEERAVATPAAAPRRSARTLIIIPAHNEEENLPLVLDELRGLGYPHDVLVVDDASTDGTSGVLARSAVKSIRLCSNLGYGGAVQTGFKYALLHGYDFAIQMDGDCQHDPSSIPALLQAVESGGADVALGSRFLGKVSYEVPTLRRAGIAVFRKLVSFFIKQPITDPTSGFQAHSRKVLEFFTGDAYPMDYPDSDVLLALHYAGFRIQEVPVAMRPRLRGQSIHGGWKTVYYLFKMFLAIFMVLLRHYRRKRP